MIQGVTHAHLAPIWYHSEPSDVPYSPNQFLGWDFFCHFLQQTSSSKSTSRQYDCKKIRLKLRHIYNSFSDRLSTHCATYITAISLHLTSHKTRKPISKGFHSFAKHIPWVSDKITDKYETKNNF